mgnify:CR=1 FL=1
MLHRCLIGGLVASAILVLIQPVRAQDEGGPATAKQAARVAVEEWVQHVDSGAWGAAWDAMAPGLRDTVSQEQWQTRGARARKALGPVRSRTLTWTRSRNTLSQNSDAGPFFVLQYHSVFGTDLYAETLLVVETDEGWRVAGYGVAPVEGRSK